MVFPSRMPYSTFVRRERLLPAASIKPDLLLTSLIKLLPVRIRLWPNLKVTECSFSLSSVEKVGAISVLVISLVEPSDAVLPSSPFSHFSLSSLIVLEHSSSVNPSQLTSISSAKAGLLNAPMAPRDSAPQSKLINSFFIFLLIII